MDIQFTGHHISVTEPMRKHTVEKLEAAVRHYPKLGPINVTFTLEKQLQIAEAQFSMDGKHMHVRAENIDMYAAIDEMAHKLDSQVRKHKSKKNDFRGGKVDLTSESDE